MSVSVRFYLFANDGLQRISQRLMQGLAHGTDAMPQYAGTRQKAADVIVEIDNGKPVRIAKADGNFLTFDKKGQVHRDLVAGGMEAMETFAALERSQRQGPSKVVDLAPKLKREKWKRDNRWTLSKQDLDLISDDVWKRKRAASPMVQQAKGVVTKPPPLTSAIAVTPIAGASMYGVSCRCDGPLIWGMGSVRSEDPIDRQRQTFRGAGIRTYGHSSASVGPN